MDNCLCLDLGTTTGWALTRLNKVKQSGVAKFHPSRFESSAIRYVKFKRFLNDLESDVEPITAVFFEAVRRHLGVDAAHAYGGYMAVLTAWCLEHQIDYEGVSVGTIKKHVTGRGNASKQQMIDAVKQLGHQPRDDNEADAISIAYWAIDNRLGEQANAMDHRSSCQTL